MSSSDWRRIVDCRSVDAIVEGGVVAGSVVEGGVVVGSAVACIGVASGSADAANSTGSAVALAAADSSLSRCRTDRLGGNSLVVAVVSRRRRRCIGGDESARVE